MGKIQIHEIARSAYSSLPQAKLTLNVTNIKFCTREDEEALGELCPPQRGWFQPTQADGSDPGLPTPY
jgi:hypothetical protein